MATYTVYSKKVDLIEYVKRQRENYNKIEYHVDAKQQAFNNTQN